MSINLLDIGEAINTKVREAGCAAIVSVDQQRVYFIPTGRLPPYLALWLNENFRLHKLRNYLIAMARE